MTIVLKGVGSLIAQQPKHRIASTFTALKAQGRKALIPFVTEFVPDIDLATKTVTITPPPGLLNELDAIVVRGEEI